jgi:hypothetical protein
VPSEYVLSLITFLACNLEYFTFTNTIHSKDTRRRLYLHIPQVNLALYIKKGVRYMSIKIFNSLPKCFADSGQDKKHFVWSLKNLLIDQSFYSVDEFTDDCCDFECRN